MSILIREDAPITPKAMDRMLQQFPEGDVVSVVFRTPFQGASAMIVIPRAKALGYSV